MKEALTYQGDRMTQLIDIILPLSTAILALAQWTLGADMFTVMKAYVQGLCGLPFIMVDLATAAVKYSTCPIYSLIPRRDQSISWNELESNRLSWKITECALYKPIMGPSYYSGFILESFDFHMIVRW